ncbi:hypothetical protein ACIPSE_39655 [Streptomyces sp. NPDC090106]|uniref:hypothetical protein n=1 Tax=Streptomyces sp. NPDC090106 TaxID=3365946 RepID=UPI00380AB8F4
MPRVPRIPWTWTVVAAVAAWLALVCGCLLTPSSPAPAPGASDVDALRAAAISAVRRQEPGAFQRLFAPGTAGTGYADRYFAELFAAPATGLRLDLEIREDLRFLVLRGGRPDGGGTLCDAWPVQESGDRSVLSAVPPLGGPCDAPESPRT